MLYPRSPLRCLYAGVLAALATPAVATDICIVQKSTDGFVALRAAPHADAQLVARAKAGDSVVIQKSANGNEIVQGRWARVRHFPADGPAPDVDPKSTKGRLGWMHKRFVDECG
jgi:hypothetical protein